MHSSHEEADTRMILHAIFADQQFKEQKVKGRIVIIIKCSDTDVLVLCVHFFPKLESTEQMWFLTGTITNAKDNRRYIPVHELSRSLSPTACQILPVSHALPLFPVQNWKKKLIFKLLRNCPEQYSELATSVHKEQVRRCLNI
jgi:hypothetical protein